MTQRLPVPPAPDPLEAYCRQFDPLFRQRPQRDRFRRYLEGLLLPTERNKTLTALANTEPIVGTQHPQAQSLQWFLSESTWDAAAVNERRIAGLRADPVTAPTADGVLVIDEHGDRKWGSKTAHIGKQYLANLGKIDTGVVSVTSLWADEHLSYPLHVEPGTLWVSPAHHFEQGKADPDFRTKLAMALELVRQAVNAGIPFRAVVADCFYGEDHGVQQGLRDLGTGYVLALKPSHAWWHPIDTIGSLQEAAEAAEWNGPTASGAWVRVERTFRDGHTETWWALEVDIGPYGPTKPYRAIVATTDPAMLPHHRVSHHQSARSRVSASGGDRRRAGGRPSRGCAAVWLEKLGGAKLQADQGSARLERVPGALGYCHPAALGLGVLRLLVLLVPPQPLSRERRPTSQDGPCRRRDDGAGGKWGARSQPDRSAPGRPRCGLSGRGWSHGSCCGATGEDGPISPHRGNSRCCLIACVTATAFASTSRHDPPFNKLPVVVLSGCQTGVVASFAADELIGIAHAFSWAGAKAVVASLWRVADTASPKLMTGFHQHLIAGLSRDEALVEAMLEVRQHTEWKHTYFWGAFTLLGDWRVP